MGGKKEKIRTGFLQSETKDSQQQRGGGGKIKRALRVGEIPCQRKHIALRFCKNGADDGEPIGERNELVNRSEWKSQSLRDQFEAGGKALCTV